MPRPSTVLSPPSLPGDSGAPGAPAAGGVRPSTGGTSAVKQLRFVTQDPAEGIEVLERIYSAKRIEVSPDAPFAMSQVLAALERVSLERVRLTGAPSAGLIDAPGTLRVARVLSGRLIFTDSTGTRPGPTPFLLPQRPYSCRWTDLDLLTLSLDTAAVEAHAAELLGVANFRLHFTGGEPVSPGMAHYLSTTVAAFGQHQLSNEEAMAGRLTRAEAFRSLATAVLHTFPGTFLDRASAPTSERTSPAGLRRAIAFMEEHLAEDIGLPEIAAAARMSPRGLQAAFRRELASTPLSHLRGMRLDAVHAELLSTDPADGGTVSGVAGRWGFAHAGRFAAAYRERYGVNPAATLRA
ncbi:helix-turn-helix domain-containing protein [Kocuria sp. M1R5S2]|uniref:helix-turn-helix domain-containing protein n=1 Tax=Kocuria rhizosphaerae TaxID=3376285 RepID=UPI00379F2997